MVREQPPHQLCNCTACLESDAWPAFGALQRSWKPKPWWRRLLERVF